MTDKPKHRGHRPIVTLTCADCGEKRMVYKASSSPATSCFSCSRRRLKYKFNRYLPPRAKAAILLLAFVVPPQQRVPDLSIKPTANQHLEWADTAGRKYRATFTLPPTFTANRRPK